MSTEAQIFLVLFAFNFLGFVVNMLYINDTNTTVLGCIYKMKINLFGKIFMTVVSLLVFTIWTLLEIIVRLFNFLFHIGVND